MQVRKIQSAELKTAIERFLAEFAAFETYFVRMVLRSFSNDASFVERTEALLDLEARLNLLKRMAFVRHLETRLIAELDGVKLWAARLRDKRDELSRNRVLTGSEGGKPPAADAQRVEGDSVRASANIGRAELIKAWKPTIAEIDECSNRTTRLQAILRSIAEEVGGRHLVAGNF